MTILAGMLIATAILYIVFLMIREANELTRTRFRFRFFALRDELAMLVATGQLKEDSWEYRHVIDVLNFHISAVEQVSMMRIIDSLAEYHLSPSEEKNVQALSKRVEDRQVANIIVGYMKTTHDLICRNSRVQISLVRFLGRVLKEKVKANTKIHPLPVNKVATPERALSAIKTHQSAFEPKLLAA